MSTPQSLTHSQVDFVNNDFVALASHMRRLTGDGSRCEATCNVCVHSLRAELSRWPASRWFSVSGCSPSLEGD